MRLLDHKLEQGSANYNLGAKSGLPPDIANTVLLEPSYVHLFT